MDFQLSTTPILFFWYKLQILLYSSQKQGDYISGIVVSILALSETVREFEPRSHQTEDYDIYICCYSTKHTVLRHKRKDWLSQNQDNMSPWSDMSTLRLALSKPT